MKQSWALNEAPQVLSQSSNAQCTMSVGTKACKVSLLMDTKEATARDGQAIGHSMARQGQARGHGGRAGGRERVAVRQAGRQAMLAASLEGIYLPSIQRSYQPDRINFGLRLCFVCSGEEGVQSK